MIILICFATKMQNATGQISLQATFGKSVTGLSYRVGANYSVVKNHLEIGGGIKIIQWRRITDDQNEVFTNRFRPDNFAEHLGGYFSLKYHPLKHSVCRINPYIFYDLSVSHATLVNHSYFYKGTVYDSAKGKNIDLLELVEDKFKPVTAVEHHLGIGFDFTIYKGLQLTQQIGGGLAHFHNVEWRTGVFARDDAWQFAWMFQIGLKYNFDLKNKKVKPHATADLL